ncbi:hypothetical protein ABZ848_40220 [Streptomyces sp. NPDC047081]|uniref:hypothetical protein n=1 Tax=Streptomyces sp. NPDC047081 TaxID=3154706 RepID=UPI0033FE282B
MPDYLPPAPESAPKKTRTNLVIIGSAAAVIAAVIGTGIVVVQSRDDGGGKAAAAASSSAPAIDAASEPSPSPSYDEVTAESFEIELKTKKRQCFGSAGCNLTVEPDLTYLGDSNSIDPSAVYEITYEIHGDESGPVIETAELSDQTSLNYSQSLISTVSAGTKVSVDITDVTTQAG